MSCPFCGDDLVERTFFRAEGWFASLDANGSLPGHTLLARVPSGSCPDSLTSQNLADVHKAVPAVAAALMKAYDAYDVLVTSLRGTVKHLHFHVIPLTLATEREWRTGARWEKGHLHEFLGHYEREAYLANQRERIELGWDEQRQRAEHAKRLQPDVARLREVVGNWTA